MTLAPESLLDRASRAVQWRMATTVLASGAQVVIGVLLARLLAPADFGVVALASVVLGLARPIGDLGIGVALVQRAELTERHVRAAFTFSVLLGLILATTIAVAAPLGGIVMRDPAVTPLLAALAAGYALGGIAAVSGALLRRQLDFKRQFFIDVGSYVGGYGVVGVTLAGLGYGPWSLVWGILAQALLSSTAQFVAVRHPVRPLLAWNELKDLLGFGVGATLNSCVNYVALNADYFIVGRWIGTAALGLYGRAYSLMNLPHTYATSAVSGALFPAFAKVQHEPARLQRGYLLVTRVTAMVAAPSLAALAIAAPHLVPSLYGPQWTGAVVPLQILCVAGYFRALYHVGGLVTQSVGWVFKETSRQAVYAILVVAGSLAGSQYGLPGVAAGVSVAIVFMFAAMAQLALRATDTSWRLYFGAQLGGLATSAGTLGAALSMRYFLESRDASNGIVAFGVLAVAAAAWGVGVVWHLGGAGFEPLRDRLPPWCGRLVDRLH